MIYPGSLSRRRTGRTPRRKNECISRRRLKISSSLSLLGQSSRDSRRPSSLPFWVQYLRCHHMLTFRLRGRYFLPGDIIPRDTGRFLPTSLSHTLCLYTLAGARACVGCTRVAATTSCLLPPSRQTLSLAASLCPSLSHIAPCLHPRIMPFPLPTLQNVIDRPHRSIPTCVHYD